MKTYWRINHLMNPLIEKKLLEAIDSGAVIITSSHRQKRFIEDYYHHINTQEVCENIQCATWDDWLEDLFYNLEWHHHLNNIEGDFPILISDDESEWLLTKSFKQHKKELKNINSYQFNNVKTQILAAYKLYKKWGMNFNEKSQLHLFNATEESSLFKKIVTSYEKVCEKNNWISVNEIIDYFIKQNVDLSAFSKNLYFYGFIDFYPLQQKFISFLKNKHFQINVIELSNIPYDTNEKGCHCGFQTQNNEWMAAAIWARELVENDPKKSIAIIIPELSQYQNEVFRIFQSVFQPQSQIIPQRVLPSGFNLSAGEPLNQISLVKSMVYWLKLLEKQTLDNWQEVLQDDYSINSDADKIARYTLKNELSQLNIEELPLHLFIKLSQKKEQVELKQWNHILTCMEDNLCALKKSRFISQWFHWFEEFLSKIGWTGDKEMDSISYQVMNQWHQLQSSLSSLDRVTKKVTFSEFKTILLQKLEKISFQPESEKAQVQILGYLEAVGLPFDEIRITGCQASSFPGRTTANPFLPILLQQKLEVANASQQRELKYIQNVFHSYFNCNMRILFTFTKNENDNDSLPSPLISHTQAISMLEPESFPESWQHIQQSANDLMEEWVDEKGQLLNEFNVHSGVQIFRNQAACPFRAYVLHRLIRTNDVDNSLGISPMQRGNWLHKSIEKIWLNLKTSSALQQTSEAVLESMIHNVVEEVILKRSQNPQVDLTPVLEYEIERTKKIITQWLEIDRNRTCAFNVETEKNQTMKISNLSFQVRVDRVDTLENDTEVIIDYKTGHVDSKNWMDSRIDEPQLPLYALLKPDTISALAFANLDFENCKFDGIGNEDCAIENIKVSDNWQQQINDWRQNLQIIGEEYEQGIATVSPKKQACIYCELSHVCRINSAQLIMHTSLKKSENLISIKDKNS